MNFFNNNITQLALVSFMDWFSKLSIEKYQTVSISGDDYFVQRKIIKVPCQWSTREKFVEIMRSASSRKMMNPTDRDKNPVEMQWILPRIAVNLSGITYDQSRRLVKTQKIDDIKNSSGSTSKSVPYSPAPYNLNIEVSTISRTLDDNLQLMEQIIPFFSPTMSMNIKFISNENSDSIPVSLNSITIENPTDIPEFEERLFSHTYSFTMKLNYYTIKKLSNMIFNIDIGLIQNGETIKINKSYVQIMNSIQDKFTQYKTNTLMPNPQVNYIVPSTYNPNPETNNFLNNAISALGDPQILLTQGASSITLETTSLSADLELLNSVKIFYRLDNFDTIYEYTNPISITFSKISYWIVLGNKTDDRQLIVYQYMVI